MSESKISLVALCVENIQYEDQKHTGNDLIVHVIAFCSGAYLTLPIVVLNLGESASAGTGITISTLFAVDRRLN